MDILHLHLLLNHVPVVGIPIGVGLLGWGVLRRERAVQRAALTLLAVTGVVAGAVFLTGEPAEEIAERIPGVTEAAIHAHEELAEVAVAGSHLVWILAVLALAVSRRGRPVPKTLLGASLVAGIAATLLLAGAANLGGRIRHTEIGAGAPAVPLDGDDDGAVSIAPGTD